MLRVRVSLEEGTVSPQCLMWTYIWCLRMGLKVYTCVCGTHASAFTLDIGYLVLVFLFLSSLNYT